MTGLIVTGTSGAIQIDQTYANLAVVQKGTLSWTVGAPQQDQIYGDSVSYTTPTIGHSPMIAFTNTSGVLVNFDYIATSVSGANTTWSFAFMGAKADGSAGTAAITYYIFDRPQASSGSTAGLKVYDGSGLLTYDSGYNYANIVGVQGASLPAGTAAQSYTYTSGRTYAIVQGFNPSYPTVSATGAPAGSGSTYLNENHFWGMQTIASGFSITPYYAFYQLSSSNAVYVTRTQYSALVLDVTGF